MPEKYRKSKEDPSITTWVYTDASVHEDADKTRCYYGVIIKRHEWTSNHEIQLVASEKHKGKIPRAEGVKHARDEGVKCAEAEALCEGIKRAKKHENIVLVTDNNDVAGLAYSCLENRRTGEFITFSNPSDQLGVERLLKQEAGKKLKKLIEENYDQIFALCYGPYEEYGPFQREAHNLCKQARREDPDIKEITRMRRHQRNLRKDDTQYR